MYYTKKTVTITINGTTKETIEETTDKEFKPKTLKRFRKLMKDFEKIFEDF